MASRIASFEQLTKPSLYFLKMAVFLALILILCILIYSELIAAFQANIFINSIIFTALIIGIAFSFRQIASLFPEISWVNAIRFSDPGLEIERPPVLLAPMAALLRDRSGPVNISTQTMRSILESVATRLDERRDLSRYMIGLLVFLGLLGTFYGLLNTISSVSATIQGLSIDASQNDDFFNMLIEGLQAPISGMGTAFSSSLFGLAGSLVLGFLDLQSSSAQNRFYVELEDWLSTVTDISSESYLGEGVNEDNAGQLAYAVAQLNHTMKTVQGQGNDKTQAGLLKLADGLTEVLKTIKQNQATTHRLLQLQEQQAKTLQSALKGKVPPAKDQ